MTEQLALSDFVSTCPTWCMHHGSDVGTHPHMSAELTVETGAQPLTARLVRAADDVEHRIVLNGHAATVEQANSFAGLLRRLVDQGTPAPAGLGFVGDLAAATGVGEAEMALAAGIDPEAVREQGRGGSVLTVQDLDRLALAVANLAATR